MRPPSRHEVLELGKTLCACSPDTRARHLHGDHRMITDQKLEGTENRGSTHASGRCLSETLHHGTFNTILLGLTPTILARVPRRQCLAALAKGRSSSFSVDDLRRPSPFVSGSRERAESVTTPMAA